MSTKLAGFYKLTATDAVSGKTRVLADWFENLITNTGLERLGTATSIDRCKVGSGSAAPSVSDTALQAQVAETTTVFAQENGAQTSAPYFGWMRTTYRFGMGAAAGNLSEVGVGWGLGLFSRALIKDSGGTPTTITVLSTEFLDVTYELRMYAPPTDVSFTTVIAGVTHNCVMRASLANNANWWRPALGTNTHISFSNSHAGSEVKVYNGTLGAVTAGPSGSVATGSQTENAYVASSLQITAALSFGLDQGNVAGGISVLSWASNSGVYQISFDPPIAKDNTKTLTINAAIQWARGA